MNQAYTLGLAFFVILIFLLSHRRLEAQARHRVTVVYGPLSVDDPVGGRGVVITRYARLLGGAIGGMELGALAGAIWAILAGRFAPYSGMVALIACVWSGGELLKTWRMRGPQGETSYPLERYLPSSQRGLTKVSGVLVSIPVAVLGVATRDRDSMITGLVGAGLVVMFWLLIRRFLPALLHTEPGWSTLWDDMFRAEGVRTWSALSTVAPTLIASVVLARIHELSMPHQGSLVTLIRVTAVLYGVIVVFGLLGPIGARMHYEDVLERDEASTPSLLTGAQ